MSSVMRFDEWQDSNGNAVATGTGGVFSAPGSVLQVVRATDGTRRSTSSGTFVDTGMSVTITPTSASSVLYIMASVLAETSDNASGISIMFLQITDSSDVALSGAEEHRLDIRSGGATSVNLTIPVTFFGAVTAGSTSAQTFKLRFRQSSATTTAILNANNTGQLFAIEVAA